MNKKIRIAITAAFLAVVMLAMTVAVSAAKYMRYSNAYDDGETICVKGSLQASKHYDSYTFASIYATIRFDQMAGKEAIYGSLNLRVSVNGNGTTTLPTQEAYQNGVEVGNYIGTTKVYPTEEQGIKYLTAQYSAQVQGTSIYFNPSNIYLSVYESET